MEKSGVEKLPFSKVAHVGVIVRDMDKAVEYYQALGIGPFESLNVTAVDRKVYGKPADNVKDKLRIAQMGRVQFELVQPVSGDSVPKKFLEKYEILVPDYVPLEYFSYLILPFIAHTKPSTLIGSQINNSICKIIR